VLGRAEAPYNNGDVAVSGAKGLKVRDPLAISASASDGTMAAGLAQAARIAGFVLKH